MAGRFSHSQAAQIDDPADPGRDTGGAEVLGALPVALGKIPLAAHGMDQVIGGIDPGQGLPQGSGVEGVALGYLDLVPNGGTDFAGIADQQTDGQVGPVEETLGQSSADITCGAGDQDL